MNDTTDLEMMAVACTVLAERGIPSDIQELLVRGSRRQGIPPGALSAAIRAVLGSVLSDAAQTMRRLENDKESLATGWESDLVSLVHEAGTN